MSAKMPPDLVHVSENGTITPMISLRDWIAGQALQGMLANPHNDRTATFMRMADDAFKFADAMLAARRK